MTIRPATFNPLSETESWQPQRVLLFSGHMVDPPGRTPPRLPADKLDTAALEIETVLEQMGADCDDLALTQGACGGDILFSEACLQHGVRLQLLQPFAEPEFIENSVKPGGTGWLNRYLSISNRLAHAPLAAPAELGPLPSGMNAYERCNLWLLASALAYGAEKLQLICLWDGGGGDGPGGTAHMIEEVKKQQGKIIWLDTRKWV